MATTKKATTTKTFEDILDALLIKPISPFSVITGIPLFIPSLYPLDNSSVLNHILEV